LVDIAQLPIPNMVQNFLVLDFFEIVNHYHLPKTFGRTILDASCKLIQVPLVQTCKIINYKQKVVRNFENQILDKHFGCFFFYDAHIVDDFHWRIAACGVEQNQPGALVHVDALERLPFGVYLFAAWKIGGAKVILNKSLPFIIQAWFWFKAKKITDYCDNCTFPVDCRAFRLKPTE
jgi:hypothetical protein